MCALNKTQQSFEPYTRATESGVNFSKFNFFLCGFFVGAEGWQKLSSFLDDFGKLCCAQDLCTNEICISDFSSNKAANCVCTIKRAGIKIVIFTLSLYIKETHAHTHDININMSLGVWR